ncbi:hypothetical protein EV715DRAFT_197626, partial [Schizophyllum commune]
VAVQIAFVPDGGIPPPFPRLIFKRPFPILRNSSSIQPPVHLPPFAFPQTYSAGRESSPGYRLALRPSSPAKSAE